MSSDFAARDMLACIQASPDAVAVHDKAAWLALFAGDGQVNDPVGSKPHSGRDAIDRFYETFIAPNDIRFEVDHDTVCDDTVVRDLVISTRMATGLQVDVPAHIRYELVEEGGSLRIHRLYAHWELPPMVMQTLRSGIKGLMTYTRLSGHMLRCQGMGGVLGFMRGFNSVGRAGKTRAETFLSAMNAGDLVTVSAFLDDHARFTLPAEPSVQLTKLVDELSGMTWRKMLVSGHTVTATITHHGRQGLALFEFGRHRRITLIRIYI